MKTDFVYRFIQNLDEGELRYCREALNRNPSMKTNGMVELFEVLAGMEHYDAKNLKAQLTHRKTLKHLPVAKTRLYRFLLQEVKRLHQHRLPTTDPKQRLEEAELLLEMGLVEEAKEVLEKGLSHLEKHENLRLEVALRDLLRKAYKQLGSEDLELKRTQNEYRLVTASSKLHKLMRYVQINERLFDYVRKHRVTDDSKVKQGVEELMSQPEIQNVKEADSLSAQVRFYTIWQHYYSHVNDLNNSIEMNKRLIRLMESDPELIANDLDRYRSDLANLAGKLVLEKRMDEAEEYLKRLEQVPVYNRRMEVQHFGQREIQMQLFYMNQGRLDEVAARSEIIDRGLRRFKNELVVNSQLALLHNLTVTFLLLDKTKKAKEKIEQIRAYGKQPVRQDIQGLARIFRLIILSEEEDQTTFPHFLRSSKRYFIEKDRHYPLEKVIYEWVKHHNSTVGSKERKTSCGILANSMNPFVKQNMIGAEEIQLWAEGKHRGISGADVFLERLG
jgi:tetratricopeptide (TPR) repeat protein